MELLYKAGEFFLILFIGWILAPIFKKKIIKFGSNSKNPGVFTFFASCISILIRVIAIVIALSSLGVDISIIVGSFSAIGLGISLALKDNMANVACGIQILFTKPFEVGDYIEVDGKEGTVTRIEIMFVTITTFSNQVIVLPNSLVVNKFVTNYSKNNARRIHIECALSLEANVDDVLPAFESVLKNNAYVLQELENKAVVESIETTYLKVGIFCWVDIKVYWDALYQINQEIQNKKIELHVPVPTIKVSQ
ncbi:mechanosensitive ion channel family protein [Floccifex sp.]|uniref:mechanosensitive ion channel family protein n=1 Tax=Floccifex sp. TaxID=2815810 RepID=UPI003F0193FD